MRALICDNFGQVGDLRIGEMADPQPAADQVLIRIHAAGLNFPDGLVVQGKHMAKPPPPFVPGAEAAGEVVAIGKDVRHLAIGDRVAAFTGLGAFGELATAAAITCYPMPDGLPYEMAAGSLITYGTAYHAFKDRARLKPGETVLVLGASGGVGLAAVELAKHMGARVIAAASTEEKLALARAQGADALINYSTEALKDAVRTRLGIAQIDVVFDPVGGDMAEPSLRLMGWGGRYLTIGYASGDMPRLPINLFLAKGAELHGILWGVEVTSRPDIQTANVAELMGWFADGTLKPCITAQYPLERAVEALDVVMSRGVLGKTVIRIS